MSISIFKTLVLRFVKIRFVGYLAWCDGDFKRSRALIFASSRVMCTYDVNSGKIIYKRVGGYFL